MRVGVSIRIIEEPIGGCAEVTITGYGLESRAEQHDGDVKFGEWRCKILAEETSDPLREGGLDVIAKLVEQLSIGLTGVIDAVDDEVIHPWDPHRPVEV